MLDTAPDKHQMTLFLDLFEKRLNFLEQERYKMAESYFTLRLIVGLLGMCLPFVIYFGGLLLFHTTLQSSISAYYHTGMRDVLVGTLWAIAFFLFSYKGYDGMDRVAGKLACIFAIGIAVFPTAPQGATEPTVLFVSTVHLIFSALLFMDLTFYALALFPKTNPNFPPTARKLQRNMVYIACGLVMLTCVTFMALYSVLPSYDTAVLAPYNPIFWLETMAIFAFGVSWFVKGEGILRDEE